MSQKKPPQKKIEQQISTAVIANTSTFMTFIWPTTSPPSQSFPVARWRCPGDTWASVRQPCGSVLNEACRKHANIPLSHEKEQLAGIHLNPEMVENPGWTFLQPLFEDTWLETFRKF